MLISLSSVLLECSTPWWKEQGLWGSQTRVGIPAPALVNRNGVSAGQEMVEPAVSREVAVVPVSEDDR